MNKRGKKIAFILSIILILSNCSVSFAYLADMSTPEKLNYLGLLDNISEEKLDQPLTRAVGIAMVIKSLGYSQEQVNKHAFKNMYSDLSDYSWLKGFAALATEMNITKGTSGDTFSPKDPLTKKTFIGF